MLVSNGFKRWLAAVISTILGVLQVIPQAAPAISVLNNIAAFFNITGLIHAGAYQTLSKKVLLSVTSLLNLLVFIVSWTPGLHQYLATLQYIVTLLSTYTVGATVKDVFSKN